MWKGLEAKCCASKTSIIISVWNFVVVGSIQNMDPSTYNLHSWPKIWIIDTYQTWKTCRQHDVRMTSLLKNVEQYHQACNETKWENKRESRLISVQNKQAIVTFLIRVIICTIRCSAPQAWPTKYKHGVVYARNLEISCNFIYSVTDIWPFGSTHPAPQLQRVLETAYGEDIVKPVHKPTNPRKHRTRNTNWRARLKLKQNDDCLSEELQSSVRPGPRCGPVGGCRLKSGCSIGM